MTEGATRQGARIAGYWLSVFPIVCLALLAIASAGVAERPEQLTIEFLDGADLADKSLGLTEPSGLSISSEGGFWSVSDNANRLFRLDQTGTPDRTNFPDAFDGLEGIVEDPQRDRLIAVKEDTSELIVFSGGEARRIALLELQNAGQLAGRFLKGGNNGLEGITVEPETGTVLLIKERKPRLLIEISADLTRVVRVVELTAALGFVSENGNSANLDVSGLTWDSKRNGLWIVSDTGHAIFFLDAAEMFATGWSLMERRGDKPSLVENAEGVALSPDGDTLFIVTDDKKNSRFLRYRIN